MSRTQIVVKIGRYTTVVVVNAAAVDHSRRRDGRFVGNIYGPGRGGIWLDDVVCNGNESHIDSCDHRQLRAYEAYDCSHSQDVSVSCVTGMKLIATTQVRACAKRAIIACCVVAQHCYNGDVSFLWGKWKCDRL